MSVRAVNLAQLLRCYSPPGNLMRLRTTARYHVLASSKGAHEPAHTAVAQWPLELAGGAAGLAPHGTAQGA
eukprot:6545985-Heterocapsa_arctica.AAC.1